VTQAPRHWVDLRDEILCWASLFLFRNTHVATRVSSFNLVIQIAGWWCSSQKSVVCHSCRSIPISATWRIFKRHPSILAFISDEADKSQVPQPPWCWASWSSQFLPVSFPSSVQPGVRWADVQSGNLWLTYANLSGPSSKSSNKAWLRDGELTSINPKQ
jgi:hypothetical protein